MFSSCRWVNSTKLVCNYICFYVYFMLLIFLYAHRFLCYVSVGALCLCTVIIENIICGNAFNFSLNQSFFIDHL